MIVNIVLHSYLAEIVKLVTRTPNRLKFAANDDSVIIFGFLMLLGSAATLIWGGEVAVLACRRDQLHQPPPVVCKLTSSNLLGQSVTVLPAGNLLSAQVETSTDDDGETYRVLLRTRQGMMPLSKIYSSDFAYQQAIIARINSFTQDPQQTSLTIQQDSRWLAYLCSSIFALIGMHLMTKQFLVTWVFERDNGRLLEQRRWLFRHQVNVWMLCDIEHVQTQCHIDSDGDEFYSINLFTQSGEQIELSSSLLMTQSKGEEFAHVIRQFLQYVHGDETLL